jgi:hypothetical protein
MRGAIHLAAILLTALGAGCATTVEVSIDEREILSRYHTWDWSSCNRVVIDAPDRNAASLGARVARRIEDGLHANGFERAEGRADFYVSYRLALRSQAVVVVQPRAAYELSSLHDTPSYLIESSEQVTRVYEQMRLAISVTGRQGETLWSAELRRRDEDIFALKLEEAVETLLGRFPQQLERRGTGASPACRSTCEDAVSAPEPPRGPRVRDPKESPDREPPPRLRCPGSGGGPDGPEPDPPEHAPESGSLA